MLGEDGTEFGHDDTAHDEERSEKLEVGDVSPQDKLVETGRDDSSEAAENDPDRWRNQDEASKVDVVVHSIDHWGEEELE